MLNFWSDMMRLASLAIFLGCLLLVPSITMAQDEGGKDDSSGASASRYIDLKPAFVVNYGGAGKLRYLKTDIALRVGGDSTGPGDIRHHMPYIRHALVMRLSRASEEELSSMEGKELLRQEALESVRDILVKEEGAQYVEDLLFNSFIVQR
jgi:flagellar FliL protein